jgi:hypothetical protein
VITDVEADRLATAALLAERTTNQPAFELLAISWVESRWQFNCRCSSAGACGHMGLLAGRYHNPTKAELCDEAATTWPERLSFWRGAQVLQYFKKACRGHYLCCYNQGGTKIQSCHYQRYVQSIARRLKNLSASLCSTTMPTKGEHSAACQGGPSGPLPGGHINEVK